MFPWTGRKQFWSYWEFLFNRSRHFCRSISENIEKTIFFVEKKIHLKAFSGDVECSCDPTKEFLRDVWKSFVQCPRKL